MLVAFVDQWQLMYRDKYPVVPKDAAQLKTLINQHPELVSRWPEMVSRYLEDAWWGDKRHPLWGLATNPVGFAGDKPNATRSARAIEVARKWTPPGHRSAG